MVTRCSRLYSVTDYLCAFIYVRERRLVRDSNIERRLRHVALGEKPKIHLVEVMVALHR